MKFLKKIQLARKSKKDDGAADTVSFIVIMFFVVGMLISFIDVGIYFNVKNEMKSAAENGARNVALYGGTEGGLRGARTNSIKAEKVVENSITTNSTSPVVKVGKISCGPTTSTAGDNVWCTVSYKYIGLAGKFGMMALGGSDVQVTGTATSEVNTKNR